MKLTIEFPKIKICQSPLFSNTLKPLEHDVKNRFSKYDRFLCYFDSQTLCHAIFTIARQHFCRVFEPWSRPPSKYLFPIFPLNIFISGRYGQFFFSCIDDFWCIAIFKLWSGREPLFLDSGRFEKFSRSTSTRSLADPFCLRQSKSI